MINIMAFTVLLSKFSTMSLNYFLNTKKKVIFKDNVT